MNLILMSLGENWPFGMNFLKNKQYNLLVALSLSLITNSEILKGNLTKYYIFKSPQKLFYII